MINCYDFFECEQSGRTSLRWPRYIAKALLLTILTTFATFIINDYIIPALNGTSLNYIWSKPIYFEIKGEKFVQQELKIYLKGRSNSLKNIEVKINGEEVDYSCNKEDILNIFNVDITMIDGIKNEEKSDNSIKIHCKGHPVGDLSINDFYKKLIKIEELIVAQDKGYIIFYIKRLYRNRDLVLHFSRKLLRGEEEKESNLKVDYIRSEEIVGKEILKEDRYKQSYYFYLILFIVILIFMTLYNYIICLICRKRSKN